MKDKARRAGRPSPARSPKPAATNASPTQPSTAKGGKKAAAVTAATLPWQDDPLAFDAGNAGSDSEKRRQGIRLGFLIHDVSRLRRAAYDQLMRPLNVTRARWWVLAHLTRHDGMMQSELAEVLEVGKASLGTVIEQLESAGWVERRADPSDKRAKRVFLSSTAQPFIQRMILEEEQFNERILAALDADSRETLLQLLNTIKQSIMQIVTAKPDGLAGD